MFLIEDMQRGEKFGAEKIGAASFISERGERIDGFEIAHILAITAFNAPQSDDDLRRNTSAPFNRGELGCIMLHHIRALFNARLADGIVAIGREGNSCFRLFLVKLDNARIGDERIQRFVHRHRRHAVFNRLLFGLLQPVISPIECATGRRGRRKQA